MALSWVAFALLLSCLAGACASDTPGQIRLALTGIPGEMVVGWTTQHATSSVVEYTCAGCGHFVAQGKASRYESPNYTSPYLHFATLTGLNSSTTYSYRVGSAKSGWSSKQQFVTRADLQPSPDTPLRILSIGDQGTIDGAKSVLTAMLEAQSKLHFDFLVHGGDVSYANGKQPIWDQWGQLVQPFAAQVPWMVSPGNHELRKNETDPGFLFRFAMPSAQSGGEAGNKYYSFNYANAHVIALKSETADYAPQYAWLKQDLQRVNRTVTPWIIGFWHRPWYCSSTVHADSGKEMRTALEELFYTFKVDLVLTGHVHCYERALQVYKDELDPKAPLYITNGAGGNGLDDSWGPVPAWSAKRAIAYGFGYAEIFNATHLHWTMRGNDSSIIDDVWLVRPTDRFQ